jgi:two-component system, chemotaxis family, response regulator Rcp1
VKPCTAGRPVRILQVEDSPGDVRLTREVFRDASVPNCLDVVEDGERALAYLRGEPPYDDREPPDLMLLDLNLPRKDGREVLQELKADPELRRTPVIVLTTSAAERDIAESYDMSVNAYLTKPVDLEEFVDVVRSIESFWLRNAHFPER